MKNKNFVLRVVNLLFILCLLGAYQIVLYGRKQQENLTEVQARVDQLERELQDWSEQVEKAVSERGIEAAGDSSSQTETVVETAQIAYADGTYQGAAQGFGGEIEVLVEVSGGKITAITIVSAKQEDEAYLSMAEEIIDTIVEKQTTEVDTISGATYSSSGIRDAVSDALKGAVQ